MTKFVLARAELFFANTTMAHNLQDFSWLQDNSLRKDKSNNVMKSYVRFQTTIPSIGYILSNSNALITLHQLKQRVGSENFQS